VFGPTTDAVRAREKTQFVVAAAAAFFRMRFYAASSPTASLRHEIDFSSSSSAENRLLTVAQVTDRRLHTAHSSIIQATPRTHTLTFGLLLSLSLSLFLSLSFFLSLTHSLSLSLSLPLSLSRFLSLPLSLSISLYLSLAF
jgi:hypothetical protein